MSINSPANGTTSDEREQIMWDFYIEGLANGVVNAYASAVKAGYTDKTAKQITIRRWFLDRLEDLERKDMLSKAEKKLAKTLTYEVENSEGEIKTDLLRIQVDVSKHLTSTLGKNKGYTTKVEQEHSNPDGNLKTIIINKGNHNDSEQHCDNKPAS